VSGAVNVPCCTSTGAWLDAAVDAERVVRRAKRGASDWGAERDAACAGGSTLALGAAMASVSSVAAGAGASLAWGA
jgi:hypothetical protein